MRSKRRSPAMYESPTAGVLHDDSWTRAGSRSAFTSFLSRRVKAALCYDAAMQIIEPAVLMDDDWEWLAKMAARLTGPEVIPAALCCARLWSHGFAKDQGDGRYSITTKGYKALRDRAAGI